jgi:hypothetical protein
MALMDLLQPGEDVVARVGPFYATSRRLLRYEATPDGKDHLTELPYTKVKGIELVRPPNHPMMAGGVVVAAAGAFLMLTWGLYTAMLAMPAGVAMIVLGGQGSGRGRYYQLWAEGANRKDEGRWRIPYYGSGDFLNAIGIRTGKHPNR